MIRTIDDLDDYMLLHGNKRVGDFEITKDFVKTIISINDLDIPEINHNSKLMTKYLLKKRAYSFFNDYYDLHKVGYLPDNRLINIINNTPIKKITDITDIYNKSAIEVDPLKLPVRYTLDGINDGVLITQSFLTEDKELHKKLLPNMKVFFTGIKLPKKNTEISTASYVHEITHSQLESHKGVIEEYINTEVLSIFNELLYAYTYCDKNVFREVLINRLNTIFLSFNSIYDYKEAPFITSYTGGEEYGEYDYHSDVKYVISALKAIKMMALCLGENRIQKYHIINLVNKVIRGEMTVEDLLDKVNINQESILETDHIKKLIKI